jgi:hypothetical protein
MKRLCIWKEIHLQEKRGLNDIGAWDLVIGAEEKANNGSMDLNLILVEEDIQEGISAQNHVMIYIICEGI